MKVTRRGYVAAGVVAAISLVLAVAMVVSASLTVVRSLRRFEAVDVWSAPETFELPAGTYSVFIEADADEVEALTPFSFHLFRGSGPLGPDDPQLLLEPPARSRTVRIGDHRYQDVGSFELKGGTYSAYAFGPKGTWARFGRLEVGRPALLAVGALAVGVLGAIVAAVLLVVTIVRRSRAGAERDSLIDRSSLPPPPTLPAPPPPPPTFPAPPTPSSAPSSVAESGDDPPSDPGPFDHLPPPPST